MNCISRLADLCPYFHRSQNCAQILFRSHAGLCPNFGRSRARFCSISFAPSPFRKLVGTLKMSTYKRHSQLCVETMKSSKHQLTLTLISAVLTSATVDIVLLVTRRLVQIYITIHHTVLLCNKEVDDKLLIMWNSRRQITTSKIYSNYHEV